MTAAQKKKPRSLAHNRVLEVEYGGGIGAKDVFRFSVTLASASERSALEVMQAESTATATRRIKGKDDAFQAILEANLAAKRGGKLTPVERQTYEVCFAHVERVEYVEGEDVFEAVLLGDDKGWGDMSFDERIAWVQQHPGLWEPVQRAILPVAEAEIEGK